MNELTVVDAPIYVDVIRIVNPLDPSKRVFEQFVWKDGKPLSEYFTVLEPEYVISLNGSILDEESYSTTFLNPGDSLVICPLLTGGEGGGKAVMRLVAMLAIAWAAGPLTGALLGSGVSSTSALFFATKMAVTFAGATLVNAMMAPSKSAYGNEGLDNSPSYGIDGPKNVAMEGIPVPVCYGKYRMGGNLINIYVENHEKTQDVYMLLNAGEGPVASLTDILINDEPIDKYNDVKFETRLGTADQEPIGWFDDTIIPRNRGIKLTDSYSYFTTVGTVDKLRFDFGGRLGFVQIEPDGRSRQVQVELAIEYRKVGDSTWTVLKEANPAGTTTTRYFYYDVNEFDVVVGENEVNALTVGDFVEDNQIKRTFPTDSGIPDRVVGYTIDNTTYDYATYITDTSRTPIRRTFKTDILPQGVYETRVKRVLPESASEEVIDDLWLEDIYEIITDDVRYRHTALVAIKIRLTDQLNSVPRVTFLNGGVIIDVWDSKRNEWIYDQASANPAWVTWDILTNTRYGLGFPTTRLDFHAWREWAEFCDENALEFNAVIDNEMNAWDAMMLAFRCGRAAPIPVGTRFSVTIERPTTPSMMFSVSNIIEKSFRQSWASLNDRANEIEVTYYDKENGYKATPMRIYDPATLTSGQPLRTAAINLFGVTDRTQAFKEAKLQLNLNRYIRQSVEFDAPLEAIACIPGDVIYVQHDMPQWGYAGRCAAGSTTTTVKLDRKVPMNPGPNYRLLVSYDSLQRYSTTVTSVVSGYYFLNITETAYNAGGSCKRIKFGSLESGIAAVVTNSAGYIGVALTQPIAGLTTGSTVTLHDTDAMVEVGVVNIAAGETDTLTLVGPLPAAPTIYQQWMYGEVGKLKKPFRVQSVSSGDLYTRTINAIEYNETVYGLTGDAPTPNYSSLDPNLSNVSIDLVSETQIVTGGSTIYRVYVNFSSTQDIYGIGDVYVSRDGAPWEYVGSDRSLVSTDGIFGQELVFKVVARGVTGSAVPFDSAPTSAVWTVGSGTGTFIVFPPADVNVAEHKIAGTNGDSIHGLKVTWLPTSTPHIVSYVIERNVVAWGDGWQEVGTVSGDSTSFIYSPVTIGTTYQIRVKAVCANGDSSEWEPAADFTTSAIDAPEAVVVARTLVTMGDGASADGIKITWTASTDPTVTNYEIQYRFVGDATWSNMATTGGTTQYIHTPFLSGKTYEIRVRGVTSNGAYTSWATAADFTASNVAPPTALTAVEATRVNEDGTVVSSIFISFTASSDATVVGYEIQGKLVADANWVGYGAINGTRFEYPNAKPGSTYQVRVRALNRSNIGSTWVQAADLLIDGDNTGPAAVTGVTGTAGYGSIRLSWTNPADPDLSEIEIWQNSTNDRLTATKVATVSATDWERSDLTGAAQTRYFWLRGIDFSGNAGAWSHGDTSGISVTTLAGGADGRSVALVYAYKRSAAAPTDSPGDVTYTFASGSITTPATDALANGWTKSIPTGTNPLYVRVASASSTATTDSILSAEWSDPVLLVQNGTNGANGTRTAVLEMYQWSAAAPTTFPSGSSTYTWANGQFTAPATPNGWSLTPPAPVLGQTLWVARQVFTDSGTSPTSSVTWSTTTALAAGAAGTNGTSGTNGTRTAFLELYKWDSATPTTFPSGNSTYTWSSGAFTAPATLNGWSLVPGAPSPGQKLYAVSVSYADTATTSTSNVTWPASPTPYVIGAAGDDGIDGTDGINTATVTLYRRTTTSSAPTVTGSDGTYTFSSSTLSPLPTGWTTTIPSVASGSFLWVIQATAASTGLTDSIAISQWSTPQILAQKGDTGEPGLDGEHATGVFLTASSQVFRVDKAGTGSPTSITLTANQQNMSLLGTVTYSWTTTPAVTLGGAAGAATRTLSFANMGTNNSVLVEVTATAGAVSWVDRVTIVKVNEGSDAINTVLTNESHSLPAQADGTIISYSGASGLFQVFRGGVDVTTSCTFSYVTSTGFSTAPTGSIVASGASAGQYNITGVTSGGVISPASPVVSVTYRATYTYNSVTYTIDRIFTITKAFTGGQGIRGTVNVMRAITGSTWSNTEANTALSSAGYGAAQERDVVTLYNTAAGYSETRFYSSSTWTAISQYLNGNLFVDGTIAATKLTAGQVNVTSSAGGYIGLGQAAPYANRAGVAIPGYFARTNGSRPTLHIGDYSSGSASSATYWLADFVTNGPYGIRLQNSVDQTTPNVNGVALRLDGGGVVGLYIADSGVDSSGASSSLVGKWTGAAIRAQNRNSGSSKTVEIAQGASPYYSVYAASGHGKIYIVDGNGPFTGVHEGSVDEEALPEIGDIMIDDELVERIDISNVRFSQVLSSSVNQKGAIGVASEIVENPSPELHPNIPEGKKMIFVNALGEGQINVCGMGGNIERGDLIVCSSIPGKGQKQADDIVRSYTVAKARESVTFDDPTQVKMIACVYLCG